MNIINNEDLVVNNSYYETNNLVNFQSNDGIFNIKQFHDNLSNKIKYLNDDFILLGYYGVFDFVDGDVCLNLMKLTTICSKTISIYKENLKLMNEIEDKKRNTSVELARMEKLYGKKINEQELLSNENCRLKVTIKDFEKKIKDLNQQLKLEQNNIRNLKSQLDREKNQVLNSKYKLEKEMDCLKERMNKLLSDPKKQYSSIDLNSTVEKRPKSSQSLRHRTSSLENSFENDIKEEIGNNFRTQIEDLIIENRQLREQLVFQLGQMKQLCGNTEISAPQRENIVRQRNNSGSSQNSSDSDTSTRSNETFVLPTPVPAFDERIYLELQFDVIKDDIMLSFKEYFQKIESIIKSNLTSQKNDLHLNSSNACMCHDSSIENISRLQKEIFQLRKRLTDYEDIIQSKDSLLETAIQQRIRRGSLVSD